MMYHTKYWMLILCAINIVILQQLAIVVEGKRSIVIKSNVLPKNRVNFACTDSEATLQSKNTTFIRYKNDTIYVGYTQVSSNNQNPIIVRYTNNKQLWCYTTYEISNDDGYAYGLLWDRFHRILYVIFSATGTQGLSSNDYRNFTNTGWLSSYGPGGGSKVAIISRIDVTTGRPLYGTFVSAINNSTGGNTNSLEITKLGYNIKRKTLSITSNCWWLPRNINRTAMTCTGTSPFQYNITFTANLTSATFAFATTCY